MISLVVSLVFSLVVSLVVAFVFALVVAFVILLDFVLVTGRFLRVKCETCKAWERIPDYLRCRELFLNGLELVLCVYSTRATKGVWLAALLGSLHCEDNSMTCDHRTA